MTAAARSFRSWPLAVVHEIASLREAAARLALAEAFEAERRRTRGRDGAAHDARSERLAWELATALAPGGGTGAEVQQRARHLERLLARSARLDDALRRAEAALAEARRETERRREALISARSAVRALERHRDAWRASLADARAKRDDLSEDELVSARPRAGR